MSAAGKMNRPDDALRRAEAPRFWNALLWSLIYPRRTQRIGLTVSGALLIALSFGIGLAAYNAGNNILFITLALLLGCLVLSGVLSWLNFRRVRWTLNVAAPLRVGQEAVVTLALQSEKRVLPTYGLWFDLAARAMAFGGSGKAETTFSARSEDVKAALAQIEAAEAREQVFLDTRLDPAGEAKIEWIFKPQRRGPLRVDLESVGSLFPFGFLKKSFAAAESTEALVWPAAVEYRRFAVPAARQQAGGERVSRVGGGSDLLALRRYEMGDSHRMIHWKASARTRRLLVRQFAGENSEEYSLWVNTRDERWVRADQFELLLSFAATLAEDLFRAEKLASVALDADAPRPVRRVRDLETFLDALAAVAPLGEREAAAPATNARRAGGARRNVVTFAPDGARNVEALVDGRRMAVA